MSFLKALRGKGSPGKAKKSKGSDNQPTQAVAAPVYQDPWEKTLVTPDEICELVKACTTEIKSRGLTAPFFILPFRPTNEPSSARPFIRKYFSTEMDFSGPMRGDRLARELRLTDITVLCSIMKWCWARLPGGVVSWGVYDTFREGEADSEMSRNAFPSFMPMIVDSEARSSIIFDFFDLLSAIAANGKHNGLTGLKISRMAGWWAFEHSDNGFGFEGGYDSYAKAALATCHLFFSYLRSLAPSGSGGVSVLPLSLQQLLYDIEYPPNKSSFLNEPTSHIIMTVDTVSPTPFALLRRARNFDFTEESRALQEFSDYEDPVQALTEESKRILKCISAANQSAKPGAGAGLGDQSWSRFQDLGFSALEESESSGDDDSIFGASGQTFRKRKQNDGLVQKQKTVDLARPTTPSWADFMASGFAEAASETRAPAPILLSPDKLLPAIETSRARSVQSNRRPDESHLEPGELASITTIAIDDAFWLVWMTSLAPEETSARKAVFGRCAMFDTVIRGIKWVIVEEKVKGALKNTNNDEVFLATKKDKKRTMRNRLIRRRSVDRKEIVPEKANGLSTTSLSQRPLNLTPEQQQSIRQTAATLRQRGHDLPVARPRPNPPDRPAEKVLTTASVMTLQPTIMKEASPAMTWAKNYDKEAIRDAYLGGATSLAAVSQKSLPPAPAENGESHTQSPVRSPAQAPASPPHSPLPPTVAKPKLAPLKTGSTKPTPVIAPVSRESLEIVSDKPQPPVPQPEPEHHEEPAPLTQVISRTNASERAMSPELSDGEASKKVSKLRKLFGSTKPANRRASVQVTPKNLAVPEKSDRRPSLRGKPNIPPISNGNNTTTAEPTAFESFQTAREAPVSPKPIATRETTPAASIVEETAAKTEFSRFDQGPLDAPAFVPEDSPEPSPVRPNHSQSRFAASREHIPDVPAVDNRYDVSPPSEADEPVKVHEAAPEPKEEVKVTPPSSPQTSPVLEPVQDRWAQIKANAAARAKANQAMGSPPKPTQSPPPVDAEESIESRVARIKARVAQLLFEAKVSETDADFMFPSDVCKRFDNRKMIPKVLTAKEKEREMQAKYERQLAGIPEQPPTVEYVPNEDYYNPPQYTKWEYLKMAMTPRPKIPATLTTTYQFHDPYAENTNLFDYRDMYPDRSEETLRRWFPRYYQSDDEERLAERYVEDASASIGVVDQYSIYDNPDAGRAPPRTPSPSASLD
ncbi:hypothetical protein TWF703_011241 [Orbilia oligospora]|uniref:Meiotically up-regulated protein Msb1/Mug8 domain-containing protein n=1 Tax=Orbilia oligospora TaxID=2813651 RepID=A0A7C8NF44_ORBOL|nr:hypothetical protein TWF703_011241 [Orbilia oligospora]